MHTLPTIHEYVGAYHLKLDADSQSPSITENNAHLFRVTQDGKTDFNSIHIDSITEALLHEFGYFLLGAIHFPQDKDSYRLQVQFLHNEHHGCLIFEFEGHLGSEKYDTEGMMVPPSFCNVSLYIEDATDNLRYTDILLQKIEQYYHDFGFLPLFITYIKESCYPELEELSPWKHIPLEPYQDALEKLGYLDESDDSDHIEYLEH